MAVIFSLFSEWWVGPRKWATWASLQRPWRRQRPQLFQVVQRVSQGMEGMAPQPSWGHGAWTFTAEWRTKAEMMLAEGLGVEAVALHNLTCECSNGYNEYQDIPGIILICLLFGSVLKFYTIVCVCVSPRSIYTCQAFRCTVCSDHWFLSALQTSTQIEDLLDMAEVGNRFDFGGRKTRRSSQCNIRGYQGIHDGYNMIPGECKALSQTCLRVF